MSVTQIPTTLELYMIVKDAELIRRLMATHRPKPITARQLARDLGWSSHTYANRILTGEVHTVTIETAVKIAFILGTPVDLLFLTKASSETQQSVRQKEAS